MDQDEDNSAGACYGSAPTWTMTVLPTTLQQLLLAVTHVGLTTIGTCPRTRNKATRKRVLHTHTHSVAYGRGSEPWGIAVCGVRSIHRSLDSYEIVACKLCYGHDIMHETQRSRMRAVGPCSEDAAHINGHRVHRLLWNCFGGSPAMVTPRLVLPSTFDLQTSRL